MIKKIIILSTILFSLNANAASTFYVPSELICTTPNVESCFTTEGTLNIWQLKVLDTVKIGTYKLNIESLRASAPNEYTVMPVQITLQNGSHKIEANLMKLAKAWVEPGGGWGIYHHVAYCLRKDSKACPLIEV